MFFAPQLVGNDVTITKLDSSRLLILAWACFAIADTDFDLGIMLLILPLFELSPIKVWQRYLIVMRTLR